MDLQNAKTINYQSTGTKDKLGLAYGQIEGTLIASALSQRLKNTNYIPERSSFKKAGTVAVRRFKNAVSQVYGTARAAGAGNVLQNNGVDVKIDTYREIAEEASAVDVAMYNNGSAAELLASRSGAFAAAMAVELDNAYFVQLQTAASTVDLSSKTAIQDKVLLLVRTLEDVSNENVDKVERSNMVITIHPKFWDDLKSYIDTLPNPVAGGVAITSFHGVEILAAPRQDVDICIQYRGAVAQPVVLGEFKVFVPEFSEDNAAFMSYFYGTKAIMPDLCMKAALEGTISV